MKSRKRRFNWTRPSTGFWLGLPLIAFVALPVLALVLSASPEAIGRALRHPMLHSAAWLSLRTSLCAMGLIILLGTPLAWFFARAALTNIPRTLVEMPIVIPPAVMGIALLQTYGASGLLAGATGSLIPFTPWAVVIAQVIVAAPFYTQAAAAGFREIDSDVLLTARTLGASPTRAFFRIVVPGALPALSAGAALAWTRALGEFGATLLFAGNMPDQTRTMPLAIYSALEADIDLARAMAVLLGGAAFLMLLLLRLPLFRGSKEQT